jgi:RecJ-like exonuclease
MFTCSWCSGVGTTKCFICEIRQQNKTVHDEVTISPNLSFLQPLASIGESDCPRCYGTGSITCSNCEGQGEVDSQFLIE